MSLLKQKYKSLAPKAAYLSDIVVLSQAWKKSHAYVRRHNWYQNTLELDCSAIELEANLSKWSLSIKRGSYRPSPLRLVPAPKSALWTFSEGWSPQENDPAKHILRPLAHLGIREQSVATAVMLCLADCIETAQGNPDLEPKQARDANVYSYGNRLYSRWDVREKKHRAHFSWGNSDVYSRYYKDYKNFVNRPVVIAQSLEAEVNHDSIHIVKIDLSAFFDNIDIAELINCLKREYSAFRALHLNVSPPDAEFWRHAKSALTFLWDSRDLPLVDLLKGKVEPKGLPQGMVSSGFFANAYLLAFDRYVGQAVRRKSSVGQGKRIKIHDYCRYVDDLRIVVSVDDPSVSESDIKQSISKWIQNALDRNIKSPIKLHVNQDKTEVEQYSAIGGNSGVVARMNAMQKELSGPFDTTTLAHVEAGLQGLLALAELGLQANVNASPATNDLSLSSVATPKLEVRDDTLTRFSAYRLTKALRLRRGMTDLTEVGEQGASGQDALLHEFEVAARRLVAAWAVNPSLVQVLVYGLDLFPSPELLKPVTEALLSKVLGKSAFEKHVAWYVLSEVMRAGATHTGRTSMQQADFPVGDVKGYREHLVETALVLLSNEATPWYVRQQALLLISAAKIEVDYNSEIQELSLHLSLADYVRGSYLPRKVNGNEVLSVALVGYQMLKDKKHFIQWLRTFLKSIPSKDMVARTFEVIGQTDTQLFSAITKSGKGKEAAKLGIIPRYLGQYIDSRWPSESGSLPINEWLSLSKVLTHPKNPLVQENALLQLLQELIREVSEPKHNPEKFTPLTIELRCTDWNRLNDPRKKHLEVRYRPRQLGVDPRYATPPWCDRKSAWLYALGRVVRAAATGELDYTASHWVLRDDIGWYSGIKSSWQKRRSGMSQSASALGGSTAGTTQWFSELLLRMLSWPGISSESYLLPEMDMVKTPADLRAIIGKRLDLQSSIYGKSSDLPVYVHTVDWKLRDHRTLRVALIQGLLPRVKDFGNDMSGLDEPGFRARHRNHLASVLHLAHRKISAKDTVNGDKHSPRVDLVICPEYSVHVADQDIMRQLSDSLGAMLFYGLAGAKHPEDGTHVNAARWLVPQRIGDKRSWVEVDQGKGHLTQQEIKKGVKSWRPYQAIIELNFDENTKFRIAGAICYDATDLALAADLRDLSHMFVVPALNRDVKTFDSMVAALRYHMYQHVLIANTGEFGGSTAQAPYEKEHERLIAHSHGNGQLSVNIFDVDIDHFGPMLTATQMVVTPPSPLKVSIGKTPPAGLKRK